MAIMAIMAIMAEAEAEAETPKKEQILLKLKKKLAKCHFKLSFLVPFFSKSLKKGNLYPLTGISQTLIPNPYSHFFLPTMGGKSEVTGLLATKLVYPSAGVPLVQTLCSEQSMGSGKWGCRIVFDRGIKRNNALLPIVRQPDSVTPPHSFSNFKSMGVEGRPKVRTAVTLSPTVVVEKAESESESESESEDTRVSFTTYHHKSYNSGAEVRGTAAKWGSGLATWLRYREVKGVLSTLSDENLLNITPLMEQTYFRQSGFTPKKRLIPTRSESWLLPLLMLILILKQMVGTTPVPNKIRVWSKKGKGNNPGTIRENPLSAYHRYQPSKKKHSAILFLLRMHFKQLKRVLRTSIVTNVPSAALLPCVVPICFLNPYPPILSRGTNPLLARVGSKSRLPFFSLPASESESESELVKKKEPTCSSSSSGLFDAHTTHKGPTVLLRTSKGRLFSSFSFLRDSLVPFSMQRIMKKELKRLVNQAKEEPLLILIRRTTIRRDLYHTAVLRKGKRVKGTSNAGNRLSKANLPTIRSHKKNNSRLLSLSLSLIMKGETVIYTQEDVVEKTSNFINMWCYLQIIFFFFHTLNQPMYPNLRLFLLFCRTAVHPLTFTTQSLCNNPKGRFLIWVKKFGCYSINRIIPERSKKRQPLMSFPKEITNDAYSTSTYIGGQNPTLPGFAKVGTALFQPYAFSQSGFGKPNPSDSENWLTVVVASQDNSAAHATHKDLEQGSCPLFKRLPQPGFFLCRVLAVAIKRDATWLSAASKGRAKKPMLIKGSIRATVVVSCQGRACGRTQLGVLKVMHSGYHHLCSMYPNSVCYGRGKRFFVPTALLLILILILILILNGTYTCSVTYPLLSLLLTYGKGKNRNNRTQTKFECRKSGRTVEGMTLGKGIKVKVLALSFLPQLNLGYFNQNQKSWPLLIYLQERISKANLSRVKETSLSSNITNSGKKSVAGVFFKLKVLSNQTNTFYKYLGFCDYIILKMVWKWCSRKHSNQSSQWIRSHYFYKLNGQSWVFALKKIVFDPTILAISP